MIPGTTPTPSPGSWGTLEWSSVCPWVPVQPLTWLVFTCLLSTLSTLTCVSCSQSPFLLVIPSNEYVHNICIAFCEPFSHMHAIQGRGLWGCSTSICDDPCTKECLHSSWPLEDFTVTPPRYSHLTVELRQFLLIFWWNDVFLLLVRF